MADYNTSTSSAKSEYLFIDFCINDDVAQRLDLEWKKKGICVCELDRIDSDKINQKLKKPSSCDTTVILKKINSSGETMSLFGHGCVRSVKIDDNGICHLRIWWSEQKKVIKMPLMGCNASTHLMTLEDIDSSLSEEAFEAFGEWLQSDPPRPFGWDLSPGDLFLIGGAAAPGDFGFFIQIIRIILGDYAGKIAMIFSGEWENLSEEKKQYLETSTSLHDNTIKVVSGTNWSIDDIRIKSQLIKSSLGTLDFLIIDDYSHKNSSSIFSDDDLKHLKGLASEFNVLLCLVSQWHQKHQQSCVDGVSLYHIGMPHETNRDLSLEKIGMKFGISADRIRQIEAKAMSKLRRN